MMSPLSFIIMLLIMIIIPTILYSFFFLINCPTTPFNPFRRRTRFDPRTSEERREDKEDNEKDESSDDGVEIVVVGKNYELGKEMSECPVCLAVFVQGEKLKKLNICNHLFHKSCIDKWLASHFNCPVCRAFVGSQTTKPKERENTPRVGTDRRDDLWQGLPDSAGLV